MQHLNCNYSPVSSCVFSGMIWKGQPSLDTHGVWGGAISQVCRAVAMCFCSRRSLVGVRKFEQKNDNDKPKQVAETIKVGPSKNLETYRKPWLHLKRSRAVTRNFEWMRDAGVQIAILPWKLYRICSAEIFLSLTIKHKHKAQTRLNAQQNRRF